MAYKAGGAIFVLGKLATNLVIEESVFDANAVRPAVADAGSVDLTVRLNTGGFIIDPEADLADVAIDAFVPIWRIDDGPVHGISWELCQRAKESSLTAESRGFPASWPSDLPCANISYSGPDSSYAQMVSVSVGAHTLWTGIMAEVCIIVFP